MRKIYLERNKAKKIRPSYLTFDGAVQMEDLRLKIEKLLLLPHQALDSQGAGYTVTECERSLIRMIDQQARVLLEFDICAGRT